MLFKVFYCFRCIFTASTEKKDSSSIRAALFLELCNPDISYCFSGNIACHVIRIVGHAYLCYDVRRGNNLAGKYDGLLKMIFIIADRTFGAVLRVHIRRTYSALSVRLHAFKGICIQEHGTAHVVCL